MVTGRARVAADIPPSEHGSARPRVEGGRGARRSGPRLRRLAHVTGIGVPPHPSHHRYGFPGTVGAPIAGPCLSAAYTPKPQAFPAERRAPHDCIPLWRTHSPFWGYPAARPSPAATAGSRVVQADVVARVRGPGDRPA